MAGTLNQPTAKNSPKLKIDTQMSKLHRIDTYHQTRIQSAGI